MALLSLIILPRVAGYACGDLPPRNPGYEGEPVRVKRHQHTQQPAERKVVLGHIPQHVLNPKPAFHTNKSDIYGCSGSDHFLFQIKTARSAAASLRE